MDNENDRGQFIEQKRRVGKIMDVVFNALFICDIENDKICPEIRPKLSSLVEQLAEQFPPELKAVIPPIKTKVSITRESLETIHQTVMAVITDGLRAVGMRRFEENDLFKRLEANILEAIRYEKGHRDAEKVDRER